MNISLKESRVVITGATGIVGRRIVRAFAQEGARLYLTGREAKSDVASVALELGAAEAYYSPLDLSDLHQVLRLPEQVKNHWEGVDVLVNNAGRYPLQPLLSMTMDSWDQVLSINLRAPFVLTKEMARIMIDQNISGSIINISSGAAFRAKVGHGHYSTSKAGLEMLTKSFALELAPFGIRVNTVVPGFAPGSGDSPLPPEYTQKMIETIPLGRTSGEMDAAAAMVFLASPWASFITGTTIIVDGGRTAGILTTTDRQELLQASHGG
ncbi:MAG: oxidoreductase [Sulfobacillus benefaciens]|uniref:Oxidoreductase n=1 Tax=Sulfobacillus benefaciens TaxID=453960 RepID=A0A2T2X7C0_9FIRM|nr:MAG: oxidoreductase [Sulfobacillus benefaciens]